MTASEETPMTNPPRYPDIGDDTGMGPDPGSTTSTPRWGWVLGIGLVILLLLLMVVLHLTGTMGPGLHGHH